ncbi:MAG: NusG domain II-containing protein [Nitrospirota bacterium]|nr:NusG domain II-containing protein [Nitrospirota bacterium]
MKPMDLFRLTTWGDRLLVVILAVITLAAFPLVGAGTRQSDIVIIEVDGKPVKKVSLKNDGQFTIHGVIGDAVFEVKEGKVHAESAPCSNKVCIHQGWTNMPWKLLVCIPNKVVVRPVDAGGANGVDAVTW